MHTLQLKIDDSIFDKFMGQIWHNEVIQDNARRQLIHRFRQKTPGFPLELVKTIGYKLQM